MKKAISTSAAPKAIGPYSQAIAAGGFLYISGQLPIAAETGKMPDTIEAQARASLQNIDSILREAGYARNDVVKTTVFLADMADFDTVNKIYAEFFQGCLFPARVAIQAARLPKDARVEIESIAYKSAS
ncbi:MAG: Rid family detoxifying hydrolase [Spirochaetales bacterium]|jgi:2-iminobutanoate/2-iminopropanoate deaminase|nr:Rid family detoxifying hydrolase [Spirochaetales bacterium]